MSEKRDAVVVIRVSREERNAFALLAKLLDRSVSDSVRHVVKEELDRIMTMKEGSERDG